MINNVIDPKLYPVIFSLDRRNLTLVDNRYATVTFCIPGDNTLANAVYYYDGKYTSDVDLSSEKNVVFVKDRMKSVFEFLASSTDISSATFSMKIWKDSSSFSTFNSGDYINVRQSPWLGKTTSSLFYSNNSMKAFSPIIVEGVSYYPSINTSVTFYPKYYSEFPVNGISLTPGMSVSKDLIDSSNWGVLFMICKLSASWYYDQARSLPVSSLPDSISFSKEDFVCRVFMVSPGRFSHEAATNDGICIVNKVFTKDYIISISGDYGSLYYTGNNIYNQGRFFYSEDDVIVDNNGYCAKPGSLSQIYSLEGYSSSSSSFCSSSSSESSISLGKRWDNPEY